MSTDVEQLKIRHHELEEAIDRELAHASPNDNKVGQMKRQKLAIKDEIVRLEHTAA